MNVTATHVNFYWDVVPGSVACQVKAGTVGGGFPYTLNVIGFEPNTTSVPISAIGMGEYLAKVRCACSLSPLTATGFSDEFSFGVAFKLKDDIALSSAINLTPNPASEFTNVSWEATSNSETKIEIIDLSGNLLHTELVGPRQSSHNIETSNLPNGTYLLKLINEIEVKSTKLVIVH